ncbi:hypothetical protein MNAN1_000379 [Malassezia nana]|uniref:Major facilitator superfamily (MFS) profile domain-containing protein n=1 Tax=Malassezia nana TaxID=180528 RepID=A0AAF0J123_9BASI|nr:hypothetical protein MNAN1_000379 [Malassezia nana]
MTDFKDPGQATHTRIETVEQQQDAMSDMPLEVALSPEEYKQLERRARFKVDLQVVPLCLILYLLSFLDRTNIGQANLEGSMRPDGSLENPGLSQDLGMTPHDYAIALTVLYPPYIALEIPSNLLLKRIGPRMWIPLLVMCWGVVSTLQGIVHNRAGLLANRVFLGATEAGILPGIAVYLTFFYKPRELQLRQALFFTGASLSGAFSGLLAAAIRKMDNIPTGFAGWRWIFILEGIFTVLAGVACLFLLPNDIKGCWGLTPMERRLLEERLQSSSNHYVERQPLQEKINAQAIEYAETTVSKFEKQWRRDTLRTFTDPRLLLMCCAGFCCAVPVYSIAYFSPVIVQNIGNYTSIKAMLMSCPPFAISFVYTVIMSLLSDHLQLRFVTAFPGMLLSVIGFAVIYAAEGDMTRYGGLIMLTCGAYSLPPVLFAWLANNSAGHYKRATGLALMIVFTNCGGLTSSWLFPAAEKPKYTRGLATNLAMSALGAILIVVIELLIYYERKLRNSGKRDDRVLSLHRDTQWKSGELRAYLGDDHPEYRLEIQSNQANAKTLKMSQANFVESNMTECSPQEERPLYETLSSQEYKRIERIARFKVDLQIVPLCLILYLLSFLDRTNIGHANLEGTMQPDGTIQDPGLSQDLGLSAHDYAVALTVLYPPYIALEIPSNLVLRRIGARVWIPLLVVAWGIVSTLQGIVSSKAGLLINRVFLGATEAGILPAIAVYLTFFYLPHEMQLRQTLFFTGAALAGAFSGLLAAAIRKMDNIPTGFAGWRWIFILEGIFTVLFGVLSWFLLPNNLAGCLGLTPIERRLLQERLTRPSLHYKERAELHTCADPVSETRPFPKSLWRRDTLRALCDVRVWLLCCTGFCCSMPLYSIAIFSPVIVQDIGEYTSVKAMLMTCPIFAAAFGYSVLISLVSDRLRNRFVSALPGMLLSVIGFAVVYAAEGSMTRYGGLILLACGCYSVPPLLFTWLANNSAGHFKRATGLAMIILTDNCGGLTSSWLFNKSEKPRYVRGIASNMAVSALGVLLVLAIEFLFYYERLMREKGRRDERVLQLQRTTNWTPDEIRAYLGDDHPEYILEL